MPLIKCYECGDTVSTKADVCPHCGAPVKKEASAKARKKRRGCLLTTLIIFFIGIVMLATISPHKKHPPDLSLRKALAWTRNYYTAYPIGGGWELQQVVEDNGGIRVDIAIPRPLSGGDTFASEAWQRGVVESIACPNKHERIWRILGDRPFDVMVYTWNWNFSLLINCIDT
jgi:hypothetical protein